MATAIPDSLVQQKKLHLSHSKEAFSGNTDRFARNRPGKKVKGPPCIDRRRLTNDPHLRQEVATKIGDHFRAFPPSGSIVDDVENAFMTAELQKAERVVPPRAQRVPRRGWTGYTQAEAEINIAMTARRAA